MKKIFRWALIYLLLVIGLFLILVGVNWYLIKQKEVRLGMARPDQVDRGVKSWEFGRGISTICCRETWRVVGIVEKDKGEWVVGSDDWGFGQEVDKRVGWRCYGVIFDWYFERWCGVGKSNRFC
ncbi:MAG: hypothetical protein HZC05_00075 [Candidatus Magasanikbacteria bacterium]|nr:hypothetical protein [Candidatus Magasanikbacteria bacterium]